MQARTNAMSSKSSSSAVTFGHVGGAWPHLVGTAVAPVLVKAGQAALPSRDSAQAEKWIMKMIEALRGLPAH